MYRHAVYPKSSGHCKVFNYRISVNMFAELRFNALTKIHTFDWINKKYTFALVFYRKDLKYIAC